ncbi:hypothetical protein [Ornithinimicrobium tianjinense]|uniref:Uncharacterized protein n=1 Tax=Ornithinimicrobium tianjinense TaxID=1195761 RepID=A0A917BTW1_9MICO|nr:hypothetical protein [Ornithinimicrobium tianjinense]GGF56629.1 hypothetical protein GCM10011366_25600 [Ornithinimicrobium tianjinense]
MDAALLRALEDLLRRVLRAPSGIDLRAVASSTRGEVARRRARHQVRRAVLLGLAAALVLLGWYAAGRA